MLNKNQIIRYAFSICISFFLNSFYIKAQESKIVDFDSWENSAVRSYNSWSTMNLKGKVKAINEKQFGGKDKFGVIEKEEEYLNHRVYWLFNQKGSTTEYLGEEQKKFKLIYDSLGNLVERNKYSKQKGTKKEYLSQKVIFKYDEKRNKIEEKRYDEDGNLTNRSLYKYDNFGVRIVEAKIYTRNGELFQSSVYTYDERGNRIEDKISNKEENTFYPNKSIYKYDNEGNEIENSKYYKNGVLMGKWLYKYKNGHQLLEVNQQELIFTDEINKRYDYSNLLVRFNDKSDIIEYTTSGGRGTYTYEYEYDSHSNWIKKIMTSGNYITITEREILYY